MNSMPNGNGQATTRLILVVEDDPTILEFLCEILEEEGFVVEPRESADAALTFLEESAHYVDLLLTDITMPGKIDGADLANLTGDRWPQIPLLIMSGFETYLKPCRLHRGQALLPQRYILRRWCCSLSFYPNPRSGFPAGRSCPPPG
ncbi:response regulator [Pseudomonas sp. KB_12]|uniref:response regulator n=1 Tax=Pseudomonas sp. KB_12 TaxID=3233034 RepID=UPI003F9706D2